MDWDKIHTIQDLLDPTSSDNSEQYDTKRTEANELPFPPLRLTLEDSESNFPTVSPDQQARMKLSLVAEAGRLDPIDFGHPDVHQYDIRHQLPGPGHHFLTIGRLPYYFNVWHLLQQCPDPLSEKGMVIRQKKSNRLQLTPPLLG